MKYRPPQQDPCCLPRTRLVALVLAVLVLGAIAFLRQNGASWFPAAASSSAPRSSTGKSSSSSSSAFADIDAGSCGVKPATADDPTILELQKQLEVNVGVRRYCVSSKALSIANFSVAGGKRSILPNDHYLNAVELAIFQALHEIYTQHDASTKGAGKNEWMMDIGMNAGLFTSHAAALGLNVLAFEPQLACIAMQHLSVATNGQQDRVRLLNVGIGLPTEGVKTFDVHTDQCHGGFRYPDKWEPLDTKGVGIAKVPIVPLSKFLEGGRHVLVAKMDVESNEVFVLESALEMLPSSLDYLIVEFSRHNWLSVGVSVERGDALMAKLLPMAKRIIDLGTMQVVGKEGQPALSFNGNFLFEFVDRPIQLDNLRQHSMVYC